MTGVGLMGYRSAELQNMGALGRRELLKGLSSKTPLAAASKMMGTTGKLGLGLTLGGLGVGLAASAKRFARDQRALNS